MSRGKFTPHSTQDYRNRAKSNRSAAHQAFMDAQVQHEIALLERRLHGEDVFLPELVAKLADKYLPKPEPVTIEEPKVTSQELPYDAFKV